MTTASSGWRHTAALAAMLCCLSPALAWSEQGDAVLDSLALPFADMDAPVDDPAADSTYRIDFGRGEASEGFESGDEVNHDALLNIGTGYDFRAGGVDLTASYVWESSRFGQFVLSTRATYVYDQKNLGGLKEPGNLPVSGHPALTRVPELQSSLMFSWQAGNHQATATTHVVADDFVGIGGVGDMNLQQLDELVGHIATLDLRYGYNIRSGGKSNTRISVGLRNTVDKRPLQQLRALGGPQGGKVLDANGSVAYGTIKYQF